MQSRFDENDESQKIFDVMLLIKLFFFCFLFTMNCVQVNGILMEIGWLISELWNKQVFFINISSQRDAINF